MISNTMALACLPFWGEMCEVSCHEENLFDAIVATKAAIRNPTEQVLKDLAWDIDAARWRDFSGPTECSCYNKQRLNQLLLKLYHTIPVNISVATFWACPNDWDAPMPQ